VAKAASKLVIYQVLCVITDNLHSNVFILLFKESPFSRIDIEPIERLIFHAYDIIKNGATRSADEALTFLSDSIESMKLISENSDRGLVDSDEDFAFTYEEESDPEIFFLPYVWEVTVCAISSSILEWDKLSIKIFPLLNSVCSRELESEMSHRLPVQIDGNQGEISGKDATELV